MRGARVDKSAMLVLPLCSRHSNLSSISPLKRMPLALDHGLKRCSNSGKVRGGGEKTAKSKKGGREFYIRQTTLLVLFHSVNIIQGVSIAKSRNARMESRG